MPRQAPCLYLTQVMHRRIVKPVHQFSYRLAYLRVDLRDAETVFGRWSPFSLRLSDFGLADGAGLHQFVRHKAGAIAKDVSGPIILITLPRFLGRGFNPISLFLVHDGAGMARAVVYEVRNTFGEKHHYCAPIESPSHQSPKALHVSPFLDDEGHYTFNFQERDGLHLAITKSGQSGPELYACMNAKLVPLTRWTLLKTALTLPIQGATILAAIYYEAAKLMVKRAPLFAHSKKSATLPLNEAPYDH